MTCNLGSWRQLFCYWTQMLKSLPHVLGKSTGLIEGPCVGDGGRSRVRNMLCGIEPLSIVVCLGSILVIVHVLPFVWYFIKFCFRAIKNADSEEVQEYRQRREDIHEELHHDMNEQLMHQMQDQDEYLEDDELDLTDQQLYQYPNMVDSSIQVQPRNIPTRRGISLSSLRHSDARRAGHACANMLRDTECAWQQRFGGPSAHYPNCTWIRPRSPYALHLPATPRLTRCASPTPPMEAMTSSLADYKDVPTQTTDKDFLQALQKCRIIRQTRSGAVYSVYF